MILNSIVTFCRWSGVLLMSLLIAVPSEVQINTHKIVRNKRCSLLDDNSTATADYDSAYANYTVNYIRQLQNHDYIHMTTTPSYKSILLHVTVYL